MLGADGDDGLMGLHGLEALGLAVGLSPFDFLFEDVEEADDVAQAASCAGQQNARYG